MTSTHYCILGTVEHESYLSTIAPGLHLLKETVLASLRLNKRSPETSSVVELAGELLPVSGGMKVNLLN